MKQRADLTAKLRAFFKTYQSTRTIEPEAVVFFVEDVAGYSLDASEQAIARFRRGEVPDRNHAFAPSVAEFVAEVRRLQERIDFDAIIAKTKFIEAGTPEWRALERRRGRTFPQVDRNGIIGWYVARDEVDDLPAQLVAEERALLEAPRVDIGDLLKLQRVADDEQVRGS